MPRLQYLVMLIPGIGGSILADDAGRTVYTLDPQTLLARCREPGVLDINQELHPVGLIPTFGCSPFQLITGYDGIMSRLRQELGIRARDVTTARPNEHEAVNPGAVLVAFPYDFRRSVAHNAEVLDKEIRRRAQGRKVILVAHSMGGLVAAHWWAFLSEGVEVEEIITLGTPFRGATKALDTLINGARVMGVPLSDATNRILWGWESVVELLPHWQAIESGGNTLYPFDLTSAVAGLPQGFPERAKAAYEDNRSLHAAMGAKAEGDGSHPFTVYYTQGLPTVTHARLDAGRLKAEKKDPPWLRGLGNGIRSGDGTVPVFSTIPHFMEGRPRARHRLSKKHQELVEEPAVIGHTGAYGAGTLPPAAKGPEDDADAYLCVDLDDIVSAGQHLTAQVRVENPSGDALEAKSLKVTSAGRVLSAHPDGDGWLMEVPPLEPGVHQLKVRAIGVPEADYLEQTIRTGVL